MSDSYHAFSDYCIWACGSQQMAFAAVAHIFVYPAKPYKHMSSIENAVYTTGMLTIDDEVSVQVGATSVKQSVHDVVFEGGGHVCFGSPSNFQMSLLT